MRTIDSNGIANHNDASFLDPALCGEDLAYNARRAGKLALRFCGHCADYHRLASAKRFREGARASGIDSDRPRLFGHLTQIFRELSKDRRDPIDVVIAGSADTGLLATCAHALIVKAGAERSLIRFTVLDRCRTPLELCREFAVRHRLQLTTDVVDFAEVRGIFAADIVFVHSLFNFLPFEHQAGALRSFGGWLKPNGRVVFVNSTNPPAMKEMNESRRFRDLQQLQKAVEAGALEIGETVDALGTRTQRQQRIRSRERFDFENVEMIERLFKIAQMRVETFEEFSRDSETVPDGAAVRTCVLAVLRPSD